MIQTKKTLT